MSVRVGINGFGRIGRDYLRLVLERAETSAGTPVQVVAINDITSPAAPAHLLAYDSTYGRLGRTVEHDDTSCTVDGHRVAVTAERAPAALAWGDLGVDIVNESIGRFRTRPGTAAPLSSPVTVRCRGRRRNGPSPQPCPHMHRAAFRGPADRNPPLP